MANKSTMTYFDFFTNLKGIIKDVDFDINQVEHLKGECFDAAYNNFMSRLVSYCKNYAESTIRGSSQFIANYISDIRATKSYPQVDRFAVLIDTTDTYLRKSVH